MEPENPLLDSYLLAQSSKDRPSICFLPHATDNAQGQTVAFFKAYASLPANPTYLSLFSAHTADIEGFLMEQDIIYVGGGNTRSMLALWREWGLDRILRQAGENGTVLAGVSAGANCWFDACSTDSVPGTLSALSCLGYLPGSFTPHFDGESDRRPSLVRMVSGLELPEGWAADDGAAIHFKDGQLFQCIASRLGAAVHRIERHNGEVAISPLPTEFLGI